MAERTYMTANNLAIEAALTRMRAAGRRQPNAADTEFLLREKARLLMHIEARDGGFLGLDDKQSERRAERYGIPRSYVTDALWALGDWPIKETQLAEAAE